MGQGSMLIRLIDVVFILLFGFISISQVTHKSQIDLPKSTETPNSYPDPEEIVFIGIIPSGIYLVENETRSIDDLQVLVYYLRNKKNELEQNGARIRVRLRAAWNTPIKHIMTAADVCDNLGIQKGIDVEKR